MKFRRNCFGIIVCPEYVYVSVIFASNKDKVSLTKTSDLCWLQSLSKITNSNDERQDEYSVAKEYLSLSSGQSSLGSRKRC